MTSGLLQEVTTSYYNKGSALGSDAWYGEFIIGNISLCGYCTCASTSRFLLLQHGFRTADMAADYTLEQWALIRKSTQNSSWDAYSSWTGQEIPLHLWSPKVHYPVCKRPPHHLMIHIIYYSALKVKLKLYLCLSNHHAMKTWGIRCRWIKSFTLRPLYYR